MSGGLLDSALGSALDAQVHNDRQATLLFDPSPEPDSLIEWLHGLDAYGVPAGEVQWAIDRAVEIYRSNHAERQSERDAAGAIDGHMREMVDARLRSSASLKQVAKTIRRLLVDAGQGEHARVMAHMALGRLCREQHSRIGSRTLAKELGKARTRDLVQFLATQSITVDGIEQLTGYLAEARA